MLKKIFWLCYDKLSRQNGGKYDHTQQIQSNSLLHQYNSKYDTVGHWKTIFCILLFILQGCYSPQMSFEWGWTTDRIEGVMTNQEGRGAFPNEGFILVRQYYSQFVQFGEEAPIYYPIARLVFPDEHGKFLIPFDLKASKIDLTFVMSGHVMQNLSFRRQIGVGTLFYEARMQKTAGWQDHFFVTIVPFLQQFIADPRFQLAQAHQLFLGEWLEQEKTKYSPYSSS